MTSVVILSNYSQEELYDIFKEDIGDFIPLPTFASRMFEAGILPTRCLGMDVIMKMSRQRVVFCLLGGWRNRHDRFIDTQRCPVIYTSNRLFSTINEKLNHICRETIDWHKDPLCTYA